MRFGINKLLILASLTILSPAKAESLLYICDKKSNQLTIESLSAESEDDGVSCDTGLLDKAKIRYEIYEPWQHVTARDDDHVKSVSKIHRTCKLSRAAYKISFEPYLGNFNIQSRCGAASGTKVEVFKLNKRIAKVSFGDVESCWHLGDEQLLVTRKITIIDGYRKPVIKQTPAEDDYFTDLTDGGNQLNVSAFDLFSYRACKRGVSYFSLWQHAIDNRTDEPESLELLIAEARKTGYWSDALTVAVRSGDNSLLEKLLAAGANPNVRPAFKTPLQEAVCMVSGGILVDTLLKHGARDLIGDFGEGALFEAISCHEMPMLEKILASGATLGTQYIESLIIRGNDAGLADAFTLLIKYGFDPRVLITLKDRYVDDKGNLVSVIYPGDKPPTVKTIQIPLIDLVKRYDKPMLFDVLNKAVANGSKQ